MLGALLLCLPACQGNNTSDSDGGRPVLRVGQINSNLEPMMEAAGELTSTPYRVQWSSFQNGPEAIEAQNAGSIDVAYMASTPPIFAQSAGVDVKIVAVARPLGGAQNVQLLVRPDSKMGTVRDLEGRRVALVPGTVTQYMLIRALEAEGLRLEDITSVALQAPEAVVALRRGDVDAIVLVDPSAAGAVASGDATLLVSGEGLIAGYNVLVATEEALSNQSSKDALGDFLLRVQRSLAWANENRDDWAQVYATVNNLQQDAAREAVQRGAAELTPIDADRVAEQQDQVDTFVDVGLLPAALDAAAQFDDAYNDRLFGSVAAP